MWGRGPIVLAYPGLFRASPVEISNGAPFHSQKCPGFGCKVILILGIVTYDGSLRA